MRRSWRGRGDDGDAMAADRDKDDIAAALHGLTSGEHPDEPAESTHGEPAVPQPPPAPVARAPQPARQAQPQAAPAARPAAPTAAPPTTPSAATPPAAIVPPRPVPGRARPAAPGRPAAPPPPQPQAYDPQQYAPEQHVDERTPAHVTATVPPTTRKTPMSRTVGFRRTVIPVLLTTGVMMLVMGAARWFVDEEAPLARMPIWVVFILLAAGAMFVALGMANMLFVHAELKRASRVA
jgi:hypothetical protein